MSVWLSRISKTNFVQGEQCAKALWLNKYRKDLRPSIDEKKQNLFDQGAEVGALARTLFPDGTLMPLKHFELEESHRYTIDLIKRGVTVIYEATAYDKPSELSARSDILIRKEDKSWRLIEVKSATSVKPEHILDLAFQYFVFSKRNYRISELSVAIINNAYLREGDISAHELFVLQDVTQEVVDLQPTIAERIHAQKHTLSLDTQPDIPIGSHCNAPYECDYKAYCWKAVPEPSVLSLFPGNTGWSIAAENNSLRIEDLREEQKAKKPIDVEAYLSGTSYIDRPKVSGFLSELEYPLHFLDYETVSSAIPLFDKSRPYQQIPFQFSLHVVDTPGATPRHSEFLHTERSDPRPAFLDALVSACGDRGSILVYYQTFEEGRNRELIQFSERHRAALESINERFVDLIIPYKQRYVYSPEQQGSASIKKVLPAFTDLAYDELAIQEGATASLRYLQFLQGKTPEASTSEIFHQLREYCKLDTLAMHVLLQSLQRQLSD